MGQAFPLVARITPTAAARALAGLDDPIRVVIERVGPPDIRPPQRTPFEALVRAICFQQLSGRAAATIHGRFVELIDGEVTPERVLRLSHEELRSVGLSTAKARSVADLAAKSVDGTVPLDRLGRLSDEELIERLVVVRGIGRWTAEMFLIFQLRRLDVWPVDDLGVRKGFARIHGIRPMPTPKELLSLGDRYRPYRSIAAWYCWRATEMSDLPG
ncbi:MAG TPA: DNA-3-methyladenine glycosylase 2 family protein [Acidimicrobiales bacterium]|jgi:DNA-3-methyladenine glycosylase II|nr:DNA-3-methyladenine glycosylase 2 family protein [Acidimicrobiales bacterium]